jgi:hypothetical protein
MKEDGFLAFVTATVNTEDPDDVGTTDDYMESVAQAKISVDPDVMAVYVTKEEHTDTTSIGSDDKVVQLHKIDK